MQMYTCIHGASVRRPCMVKDTVTFPLIQRCEETIEFFTVCVAVSLRSCSINFMHVEASVHISYIHEIVLTSFVCITYDYVS